MAILTPVSFTFSIIGDGVTTELNTYLAPLLISTGLPGTTLPQRLVSLMTSDGSEISGSLDGQTLKSVFTIAPADLAQLRVTVTMGF